MTNTNISIDHCLDTYIEICDIYQLSNYFQLSTSTATFCSMESASTPSTLKLSAGFFFFKQINKFEKIILLLLNIGQMFNSRDFTKNLSTYQILKYFPETYLFRYLTFQNFSLIAFNFQHERASAG